MKKFSLLLTALVPCMFSHAQEDQAIQQWQSAHPATQLISVTRYAALSEDEKLAFGTDYILFSDKITLQQLLSSEQSEKSTGSRNAPELSETHAEYIKEWLSSHQEVKIVTRSYFESLPEESRQVYADHHSLILSGEYLTVKDIQAYE